MDQNRRRVFISGPMTGIEDYNKPAFDEAEKKLKEAGFSVFNPAWMDFDSGWDYGDIMGIDMAALSRCNYIYQLEGWERSDGACAEWEFAKSCRLKVINHGWLEWYVQQLQMREMYRRKENEQKEKKSINQSEMQEVRQACG